MLASLSWLVVIPLTAALRLVNLEAPLDRLAAVVSHSAHLLVDATMAQLRLPFYLIWKVPFRFRLVKGEEITWTLTKRTAPREHGTAE